MPLKQYIKKVVEEKAKQRREEVARKEAKQKKADEAKKAEARRKIKEKNIEKNKKEKAVPSKEPAGVAKKTARAEEEDPNTKKKRRKVDQPPEVVVLDPPASFKIPPSTRGEEPGASKAPPRQDALSTSDERAPDPVPLQVEYPRNPVRDSAPWNPQILIPSLEFPTGRPFTIKDVAVQLLSSQDLR